STPVATPAPPSPPVTLTATTPVTQASAEPPATSSPAFEMPAATLPTQPPPETAPAIVPPAASPASGPPSAEVERYFEEADAVEARAKYWTDPQALAKTILEQASSGDTAAFDELILKQRSARDDLSRMSVPPECAEHHRRSLAVMAEGIGLLERVRTALASSDLSAVDGLQERARALEREAKEIDELGRKLRAR
ncbi:MAG TPA: hypothetical protein VFQ51_07635, partial [Vicinamibacteria bacterium]|nr:hypothetical protein [Vicinamibacteria bacterium]